MTMRRDYSYKYWPMAYRGFEVPSMKFIKKFLQSRGYYVQRIDYSLFMERVEIRLYVENCSYDVIKEAQRALKETWKK